MAMLPLLDGHGLLKRQAAFETKPERRTVDVIAAGVTRPFREYLALAERLDPEGLSSIACLFGHRNPAAVRRLVVPANVGSLDGQATIPTVRQRPIAECACIIPLGANADAFTSIVSPSVTVRIVAAGTDT